MGNSPTPAPEKSIAVLPFENLGDDKENSHFAAGIQDDILTSLAQIRDLKVISRTSVTPYQKPSRGNVREIGRALGVANLLEGSVRREGNRVLVNVQLIDARNDRHLWAERYDRTVADSIGLQGELAMQIAVALKATLAPEEKARLSVEPTTNSEAYVLYLTALGKNDGENDMISAEQFCVQATAIDPKFALAYARASILNSDLASQYDGYFDRKAKARAQAEEALRLSPDLGEAHMARGRCLYLADKDYTAALKEFEIAAARSPNNAEVYSQIGIIYRRQGRWRDSLVTMDRAQSLDPRNAEIAFHAALSHLFVRDWATAGAGFHRNLELRAEQCGALRCLLAPSRSSSKAIRSRPRKSYGTCRLGQKAARSWRAGTWRCCSATTPKRKRSSANSPANIFSKAKLVPKHSSSAGPLSLAATAPRRSVILPRPCPRSKSPAGRSPRCKPPRRPRITLRLHEQEGGCHPGRSPGGRT